MHPKNLTPAANCPASRAETAEDGEVAVQKTKRRRVAEITLTMPAPAITFPVIESHSVPTRAVLGNSPLSCSNGVETSTFIPTWVSWLPSSNVSERRPLHP